MTILRFVWTPYPFKAGFCITDDTDTADLTSVKSVYNLLQANNVPVTKTVWAFKPRERCGIPPMDDHTLKGITLEDPEYLDYCKQLNQSGFEICLHGASAGNNRRELTQKAFDFVEKHFKPNDTFICHSKNADNLYWEEKSTQRFPFHQALRVYCKLKSYGEVEGSPYFWGDIAKQKINQIRFYRTRNINTLAANPSMPYFEPGKPYVNGWFSATKRSFAGCTTEEALNGLKQENGLCILYHYMHKYAQNRKGEVSGHIRESIERLGSEADVYKQPVSVMMSRLRAVQGIFLFYKENKCFIVNALPDAIDNLQMEHSGTGTLTLNDTFIQPHNGILLLGTLPGQSVTLLTSTEPFDLKGKNTKELSDSLTGTIDFPLGYVSVNCSAAEQTVSTGETLPARSVVLHTQRTGTGLPILSVLPYGEEMKLLSAQTSIIAREILFQGRKVDSHKLFDDWQENILSNQDAW